MRKDRLIKAFYNKSLHLQGFTLTSECALITDNDLVALNCRFIVFSKEICGEI